MSTREDDLVCAVLELLDAKAQWQATGAEQLSDTFLIATEHCIEVFNSGDTPRDCKNLEKLVGKIQDEFRAFELYVSGKEPRPRAPFWGAIGEIENELTFCPPQINEDWQIESIQELHATGVSDRQIALMYSIDGIGPFMTIPTQPNETPQPIPDRVVKERKNPGSVLPADWVHPKIVKERALKARYDNRLARRAQELRELGAVKTHVELDETPAQYPVGPESIEELIAQGVPDAQITKIKQCTLAEVVEAKNRLAQEAMSSTESQIVDYFTRHPKAKNTDVSAELGCDIKLVASVRRRLNEAAPAA